ncbi:MAG TPA: hypothetical protein VGR92_05465 [Steroidobacteraceae bacterium]|nr:hypothetical protein [Steroidobacteraceae bacterium]
MTRGIGWGLLLLALAWSGAVLAQSDSDLSLIPPDSQSPPKVSDSRSGQNVYLENALTAVSLRTDLPVPAQPSYDWQERLLLDVRNTWNVGPTTHLIFSDRFNVRAESDLSFPEQESVVNDLREAYLEWRLADQTYLDFGRINLKSGIALGYNPTDYFKTRTVSEPLSADPTVLREDRLGTVMLRLQHIGSGGSYILAFAPRLQRASPIYANTALPSFNPLLGRTNSDNRFLLKSSIDFSSNLSPELLLYHDSRGTQLGLNLSMTLGQSVVAYVEESVARRRDLIAQALDFGRTTGALPAGAPDEPPPSPGSTLKNELAVGASYTTPGRVTWNFEYHLNQAGFTARDWSRWFAIGSVPAGPPALSKELWYIRGYAQDQQEQSTEQAAFVRADWTDALGLKLELSGFADVDLRDGSGQAQGEADYYLSDAWTLGLLAAGDFGARKSDFGSLPSACSILLSARRYF